MSQYKDSYDVIYDWSCNGQVERISLRPVDRKRLSRTGTSRKIRRALAKLKLQHGATRKNWLDLPEVPSNV